MKSMNIIISDARAAVQSSDKRWYDVTYEGFGDGDPEYVALWSCDCPAGRRGMECQHLNVASYYIVALANQDDWGDVNHVIIVEEKNVFRDDDNNILNRDQLLALFGNLPSWIEHRFESMNIAQPLGFDSQGGFNPSNREGTTTNKEQIMTCYQINRCGRRVRNDADPGTDYVVFTDAVPTHEVSHSDGQTWIRAFNAPRSKPFRPLVDGYAGTRRIMSALHSLQLELGD